mgnify:CR=1 FL=1
MALSFMAEQQHSAPLRTLQPHDNAKLDPVAELNSPSLLLKIKRDKRTMPSEPSSQPLKYTYVRSGKYRS